ncbi:DUF4295 domain-containing protein [Tenuifilum osseticum]|uniref:DUF4295 domain-containing protein n=1 Tax=Tenuifilum TaxID=2760873 RepID=UPI001B6D9336|nr:DUF4295 domain-containing protein [Bacteroidales bacterium]HOK60352.1 DUF4295 family protein [Tenuifilum sp.]MBP9029234.1 DUF4295 domain-containing protein [Bacteroidales bacterium]HOK85206.1 DUF4295 family protein [Tenuifilum sp.]HON69582.1 DUF4295 family protein [Tenuifilum sp.]
MAKKVVASLQKATKDRVKCIKMVRSPKTGAYMFKEETMDKSESADFFKQK